MSLEQLFVTSELEKKINDAVNFDTKIEVSDGKNMTMPNSVQKSIRVSRVAETIAKHLSKKAMNLPDIESTELDYGSGDTGRQSKLCLKPIDSVDKNRLREIGQEINIIFDKIFPTDYIIGIQHEYILNEEDRFEEVDKFNLFIVYNVKSVGKPQKPAGDKTEIIT